MGTVRDIEQSIQGFVEGTEDVISGLTGETAAEASLEAAGIQGQSIQDAIAAQQAGIEPFQPLIEQGMSQAGFLTDPQAQFDFLQNNPLFTSALEAANRETQNIAAARGRLSAGDTLQQLSQNVLLSASPLITRQQQNIQNLINTGANLTIGSTTAISDLITSGGAVEAAGVAGAGAASSQGAQNILQAAILAGRAASDKRLKENIVKIGVYNGHNIYTWTWNKLAEKIGLIGDSFGDLAQEVLKINPEAIDYENGYMRVNYPMIGVNHGG